MYLVTIINDNIETIINEVNTNANNRISGTVKQGINTIDSFTFTILPNNQGYNLIFPIKTKVKVLNTKTNKYEFIGRVLTPSNSMGSNGLMSKSFVCESELAYLLDSMQKYEEVHNISVKDYLNKLLSVHNSKVDTDKQFKLGNVTVIDNNDSLYKNIAYDSTKKNIEDDLINTLGGELQIRYESDGKYLDYLTEIGKTCSTEIRLGKNIKDITNDIDPTNYITRLYPLGNKLKTKDTEGNEVDSEERLTIASVNNGLEYIDDIQGIEEFGIIEGYETWDDVTEASNLLRKGQSFLSAQRIVISNKINALDLSLIGLDIDAFEVGNYYPLIHELLDINYNVRIIEKSISIDSPENTSITLGDKQKDIKEYQLDLKKQNEKLKKENSTLKSNVKAVNTKVDNNIIVTNEKFEAVDEEITKLKNNNIIQYVSDEETFKTALSNAGYIYIKDPFSITERLTIKSNTLIEMHPNAVITMSSNSMFITESNSNTTGYNGATNIILKNCRFKGLENPIFRNMFALFHSTNIIFDGVSFLDIPGSHAIDINGSRNVRIINCNFIGYSSNPEGLYREAIQLDICNAFSMPYFDPSSACYDYTVSREIFIHNCYFSEIPNAIGQHSQSATTERMEGITISNCFIRGTNNLTSTGAESDYGNGIRLIQCTNVNIVNNHIVNCGRGIMLDILNFVRNNNKTDNSDDGKLDINNTYGLGCKYINILGNTINCGTGHVESGIFINMANSITTEHKKHTKINISNNDIFDIPVNSYGMYIEDVDGCSISNNHITSTNTSIAFKVNVSNSSNVNSYNNFIDGSTSAGIYTSNENGCGEGIVLYNSNGERKLLTV